MIARNPLAFAKASFEDTRTSMELVRFCVNGFLVWLAFHEWLHHVLDQIDIGGREPGRSFPQQPSVDLFGNTMLVLPRLILILYVVLTSARCFRSFGYIESLPDFSAAYMRIAFCSILSARNMK